MARSTEPDPSASSGGQGPRGLASASVAILGCGAVGSALARSLANGCRELVLWSRTAARAEELARALGQADASVRTASDPGRAVTAADLGLLRVTDPVLAEFADRLATELGTGAEAAALLHTNGTFGLEVLQPLAELGFGTGKAHPLLAVPPAVDAGLGPAPAFQGAWFATLGEGTGADWARRLVEALGAQSLALDPSRADGSATLHAAAALLSGGFVALYDLALEEAEHAASDPASAQAALATLLASTVSNLARLGARDALTGPVARGAEDVVRRHLGALGEEARAAYVALAGRMLALAAARGTVDEAARLRLAALFDEAAKA